MKTSRSRSPLATILPLASSAVALLLVACQTEPPGGTKAASEAKASATSSEAATNALRAAVPAGPKSTFGAPITGGEAATLSDIAAHPASYKGKSIVTSGTVAAVCQEQGCWMEIKDGTGDANVRMHGHSFFVPRTSAGKKARIQGTVMLVKDGKECEEMAATGASLQFDATGIELM
ncbi:MAG: DUF4920 domain-containing protein [Polyangiaceae bacterium]